MISFKNFLLTEGVHDPAKLKAIFLAGGPGSGKSHVTQKMKGDLGFKVVNSDDVFEHEMKKQGLDFKMPEAEKEKRNVARERAKEITAKRAEHYQKGRLGMIIDGTGKDYEEIQRKSSHLRKLGYDTHMVFVNTSLDVAHQRNKKRPRSVPEDIVTDSWKKVQSNMGKFQKHFGPEKFHIVDNSSDHSDDETLDNLHKKVRHIATKEVENPVGKKWIKDNTSSTKKKVSKPPVEPEKEESGFKPHSINLGH